MHKKKIVWLSILFAIVILLGSFVIWQWNNIAAVIDSFRYSQEEVENKLNENKEKLQAYIDNHETITVRDLTEEESKALQEGNLSEEEAVAILTGKEPKPPQNNPEIKPDDKPEPEPTPEYSAVVSEAIAKLYVQKNKYLSKLDTIESEVIAEYHAIAMETKLSPEDIKAEKDKFLKRNLSRVAAWEDECDSVVYGILDEIETALKAEKQDTGIVTKLKEAYLNEKRLKKSYFINRYMD